MTIVPGFWLQYTFQGADELVALADVLGRGNSRPGIVFTPTGAPERLARLYNHARRRGEAFLDPSGFLLDRPPSAQRRTNYPWLEQAYGRPVDVAGWTRWMERSLEHQLSDDLCSGAARPSILVTPCPLLRAAAGTEELYAVVDAAVAASTAVGRGRECWIGIVVDRDFLRQEDHLTKLADALVNSSPPGVVFRCFQPELAPLTDRRVLEGFREVVEGCVGAGIGVSLPNSGWLGWLAMAWGATGFSGGLSKSSWFDRMPGPMANVLRRDTIFERQLLRHVPWPLHRLLTEIRGYDRCTCSSCAAMAVGAFDATLAKTHQIRAAHAYGRALRQQNVVARRRRLRFQIEAAIDFRNGLPLPLRARADAGFLDTWLSLL